MADKILFIFADWRLATEAGFSSARRSHPKDERFIAASAENLESIRGMSFSHVIVTDEALRRSNERTREEIGRVRGMLREGPELWMQL